MVPQPVARAQFSLGTNLNTPFSHFFYQNSGPVPVPGYKISTVYTDTKWQVLGVPSVWMQHYFVPVPTEAPVLGDQVREKKKKKKDTVTNQVIKQKFGADRGFWADGAAL